MKNLTQRQWVEAHIREYGGITRNQCLRNHISRLGAIIADLKKDGWEFSANYKTVKTPFGTGKDYVYRATHIPECGEVA
jgi:ribosomal protein L34E